MARSKHSEGRIRFQVRGLPQAQGSSRAFMIHGRPRITSTNRNLSTWRRLVADQAQKVAPPDLWLGPIWLRLDFLLPRPASEPTAAGRGKKRHPIRTFPARRPDLDKLVRAVADALTAIIYRDDSQIVCIDATKDWGTPGVMVDVARAAPAEEVPAK